MLSLSTEMNYRQILHILEVPNMYVSHLVQTVAIRCTVPDTARPHYSLLTVIFTRFQPGRVSYSVRKLWCVINSAIQLHTGKS